MKTAGPAWLPTGGGHTRPTAVLPGPVLLSGVGGPPGVGAHNERWPALPKLGLSQLTRLAKTIDLRGRGGAGFPFHRKIASIPRGRAPFVVVNCAEGEPLSAKDFALTTHAVHLVLDGAELCARALDSEKVYLVLGHSRPGQTAALEQAIRVRGAMGVTWEIRQADDAFVTGESSAVMELLSGRENLPVTQYHYATTHGVDGKPTLLSNAETYAHLAVAARVGAAKWAAMPDTLGQGTTLLTIVGPNQQQIVIEVPVGETWQRAIGTWVPADIPLLIGGYQGKWANPAQVAMLGVQHQAMREAGLALGCGIVQPAYQGTCPVAITADITDYLGTQSAGRCGPCINGLPAMAAAMREVANDPDYDLGSNHVAAVERLLRNRGACYLPTGTGDLVRSLFAHLPDAVMRHWQRTCSCFSSAGGRAA